MGDFKTCWDLFFKSVFWFAFFFFSFIMANLYVEGLLLRLKKKQNKKPPVCRESISKYALKHPTGLS